jgi:hypothetical protein
VVAVAVLAVPANQTQHKVAELVVKAVLLEQQFIMLVAVVAVVHQLEVVPSH